MRPLPHSDFTLLIPLYDYHPALALLAFVPPPGLTFRFRTCAEFLCFIAFGIGVCQTFFAPMHRYIARALIHGYSPGALIHRHTHTLRMQIHRYMDCCVPSGTKAIGVTAYRRKHSDRHSDVLAIGLTAYRRRHSDRRYRVSAYSRLGTAIPNALVSLRLLLCVCGPCMNAVNQVQGVPTGACVSVVSIDALFLGGWSMLHFCVCLRSRIGIFLRSALGHPGTQTTILGHGCSNQTTFCVATTFHPYKVWSWHLRHRPPVLLAIREPKRDSKLQRVNLLVSFSSATEPKGTLGETKGPVPPRDSRCQGLRSCILTGVFIVIFKHWWSGRKNCTECGTSNSFA